MDYPHDGRAPVQVWGHLLPAAQKREGGLKGLAKSSRRLAQSYLKQKAKK